MAARLRVKEVAQEKGFSMTKLFHTSGVAYKTIQQIYRDPYRHVSYLVLLRLANAMNVPITDLFEEIPD